MTKIFISEQPEMTEFYKRGDYIEIGCASASYFAVVVGEHKWLIAIIRWMARFT